MTCGPVAFCPYFPPGSEKLATTCGNMLSQSECVVLQNHGVVTTGSSLQEAFDRFVTLENLAQSIINAIPIGVPKPLPKRILNIREHRNTQYQKFLCSVPQCDDNGSNCEYHKITGEEKEARSELCYYVQRAYKHNLFTSSSGSISLRPSCPLNDAGVVSFLVTPTNIDRQHISPSNICFITNYKQGNGDTDRDIKNICYHHSNKHDNLPSHTSGIHATIYSMHPEVNSIIIAQPTYTTAFCLTGSGLDSDGIPESHLILGNVKSLPFDCLEDGGLTLSKSINLSNGITTFLINGFGVVSVGQSPLSAYVQVEVCESICGVMLTAMRRGKPTLLTNEQVKEIDLMFKGGH